MTEKFGIANEVLDTKIYNEYIRKGQSPFSDKRVVICSYDFAAKRQHEIKLHGFELAVVDEAHKLRNVYKKNAKKAKAIKSALIDVKKLLLTATPFQNSLMELYGLTSIIDDGLFGDEKTFKACYARQDNNEDLRDRMSLYCKRTLRKDVQEYINYTKRRPLTQEFEASDLEMELYEDVSAFLQQDNIYAIPARTRKLTTLMIRKILASSTTALIGTLTTIKNRLEDVFQRESLEQYSIDDIAEDLGIDTSNTDDNDDDSTNSQVSSFNPFAVDLKKLREEIDTIEGFIRKAHRVDHDTKSDALLIALKEAFATLPELGAKKKALIFTESTRTQKYLKMFLEENGYNGKIVLFNGSNNDDVSNAIYEDWKNKNAHNGRVTGSKANDKRAAIVDYFKNTAQIMIATEAAAEGLNFQFCSLVVNYDLPWNPQRIEQRIGRCHRYGQKSDVVVVNFVNKRNFADVRVHSLLLSKFHLFDDVFGASDDVLGQADEIDFESRILEIYQECRTNEEINEAFERLQEELKGQIEDKMKRTREIVLENFDINVQEKLKVSKKRTEAFLNRYEHMFWELTKFVLANDAKFDDKTHSFVLKNAVCDCSLGKYQLPSCTTDGIAYRLSSPLAQYVLQKAKDLDCSDRYIEFQVANSAFNVALPEYLNHASGYMVVSVLSVDGVANEDFCVFSACTDDGRLLTQEEAERLFLLAGVDTGLCFMPDNAHAQLAQAKTQTINAKIQEIETRNLNYFNEEEDKIHKWERDVIDAIEAELDTIKKSIREKERLSIQATTIDEKQKYRKEIEELEKQKRKKRNELEDREDEVAEMRRSMLEALDKKRIQSTSTNDIFVISWSVL